MSFDFSPYIVPVGHTFLYGPGSQSQSSVGFNIAMTAALAGRTILHLVESTSDGNQFQAKVEAFCKREQIADKLDTRIIKMPERRTADEFVRIFKDAETHDPFVLYDTSRDFRGLDRHWLSCASDLAAALSLSVLTVANVGVGGLDLSTVPAHIIWQCRETYNPLGILLSWDKPDDMPELQLVASQFPDVTILRAPDVPIPAMSSIGASHV